MMEQFWYDGVVLVRFRKTDLAVGSVVQLEKLRK